jgi:hypothetical protein
LLSAWIFAFGDRKIKENLTEDPKSLISTKVDLFFENELEENRFEVRNCVDSFLQAESVFFFET